jgi:hypothetical protein
MLPFYCPPSFLLAFSSPGTCSLGAATPDLPSWYANGYLAAADDETYNGFPFTSVATTITTQGREGGGGGGKVERWWKGGGVRFICNNFILCSFCSCFFLFLLFFFASSPGVGKSCGECFQLFGDAGSIVVMNVDVCDKGMRRERTLGLKFFCLFVCFTFV